MLAKKTLCLIALFLSAAALPAFPMAAQETQDAPSVAEAARRAREKKQTASKPTQVVTNDTLAPTAASAPTAAAAPNTPASTPSDAAAPATSAENEPAASPENADKTKAAMEALKKELKDKEESVNLLVRELALEQDNVYRNPDYQHDTAGKQKLESLQSDVKAAQEELAALKAKLTDLAGADALKEAAPTNPPATSERPQR